MAEDEVAYNSKQKTRVSVHDSDDDESGYNSMVCVEEEVNMAQGMSDVVYLDSGCNKMILTSRKHMKNLQRADKQMTTANKGKLTITSVGDAGNFKGVYYAPAASNNLVDMKSITGKNCTITFDEDEVVIRNKSTGKTLIRQRSINGLHPVSIEDLLKLGDDPSAAVAVEEPPEDPVAPAARPRLQRQAHRVSSQRFGRRHQPGQKVFQKEVSEGDL